jgi:hypothetical protein
VRKCKRAEANKARNGRPQAKVAQIAQKSKSESVPHRSVCQNRPQFTTQTRLPSSVVPSSVSGVLSSPEIFMSTLVQATALVTSSSHH